MNFALDFQRSSVPIIPFLFNKNSSVLHVWNIKPKETPKIMDSFENLVLNDNFLSIFNFLFYPRWTTCMSASLQITFLQLFGPKWFTHSLISGNVVFLNLFWAWNYITTLIFSLKPKIYHSSNRFSFCINAKRCSRCVRFSLWPVPQKNHLCHLFISTKPRRKGQGYFSTQDSHMNHWAINIFHTLSSSSSSS